MMQMRGNRICRAVAWLAVLALVIAACDARAPVDDADPEGTLTTWAGPVPKKLDPQIAQGPPDVGVITMVFESLLRFDPKTLLPVPAAARGMPTVSADGLTYTFTVGDHAKYSDGTPVRARDFAYGFTRLCDPALDGGARAAYASNVYVIVGCAEWNSLDPEKDSVERQREARNKLTTQGIQVLSDKEISFTLAEPARYFPSIVAMWLGSPVREADVERGGGRWTDDPATYIGNGPFVLATKREDRLVFVPNPHYHKPPRIKSWTKLLGDPDANAQFELYKKGEIDAFSNIAQLSPENRAALAGDTQLRSQLFDLPLPCSLYVGFNARRAPFDDPGVRLAFAKALDRSAFVKDVQGGLGRPSLSLIPRGLPGHDPADAVQEFDPADARRLLASSRYAGTDVLRNVTFVANTKNPVQVARANWLKQQWQEHLGMELVLTLAENEVARAQHFRKVDTYPSVSLLGWCSDYPDQQDWLTLLFNSRSSIETTRNTGFADPEFDRLTSEADREADPARRNELYLRASRILTSQAIVAFLFHQGAQELRKPWVKGVLDSPLDSEISSTARFEGLYIAKK